jgi:hypothetical protein
MKILVLVQGTIHPEYHILDGASSCTWQTYNDPDVRIIPYYGCKDLEGNFINVFREQPKDGEFFYDEKFNKLVYGGMDHLLGFLQGSFRENRFAKDIDPRADRFVNTLEYCLKHYEFDYVYRTSDSYYVDVRALKEFVSSGIFPTTKVYTGAIFSDAEHKKMDRDWCINFIAGSSCLMSRDTVEKLVENKDLYLKLSIKQPEDCATGDVLVDHLHYINIYDQYTNHPEISFQENVPYENLRLESRPSIVNYKMFHWGNYHDVKRMMKIHYLIEQRNINNPLPIVEEISKTSYNLVLEEKYNERCFTTSDINEHMPTLKKYAEKCEHITEMGVSTANSTYGLLMGKPKKMISYDIEKKSEVEYIENLTNSNNINFTFICKDVLTVEIEETDLLFIDTKHTYTQLSQELKLHAGKVKKYLLFHDTVSFGEKGEHDQDKGLIPAIEEFLQDNTDWNLIEKFENNNGFTVLEKIK